MQYSVIAFYILTPIEDPALEVFKHKDFFAKRDLKGRIYISQEGINAQMSASYEAAKQYMEWLCSDARFRDVDFKIHRWHEHCFPRATIKVRPQLVALDKKVDMSKAGVHLSPQEWKQMLENRDENTLVMDVRNAYEWDIGHFEGAELPPLETFRQFPKYARELKSVRDPSHTKVMMYCTGGIRCELYSALMKEEGFHHVYQLQGGVIKYGLEAGADHWKGKLFVFDDRLSVPITDKEPTDVISHCVHCKASTDLYFNCANMDCNALFLSCLTCAETMQGCCCRACEQAPRVRPFIQQDRPKPFRRIHGTTS